MPSFSQYQLRNIVQDILNQLGLLVRLERKMLGIIASYAIAIGLFMLGVPISVQKLVSTFSFAVEPRMIYTMALMVADAFRVLRARTVETLQQRIYTRIATAFPQTLSRLQEESFLPQHANRSAKPIS
jgi:putative ABC transport system ATP-binding protein